MKLKFAIGDDPHNMRTMPACTLSRRKFLTISALAPLASRVPGFVQKPIARIMPAYDVRLLTPFCLRGGPEGRAKLRSHFYIDGWCVATDGRVCVRARHEGARRVDTDAPTAENLNWDGPWGPGFRITPFPREGKYVPCNICQRKGPQPMNDGDWWCSHCENEGQENYRSGGLPAEFGGLRLRLRYVQQIMDLQDVVWHTRPVPGNLLAVGYDIPEGPMRFTWQHGDGLLMPLMIKWETVPDVMLQAQWEET